MKRMMITGAGRGIGLELVRQYLERGWRVFAGVRYPERVQELRALHTDQLTILPLDVNDESSIEAARHTVREQVDGLDLLINNAGISHVGAETSWQDGHRVLGHLDEGSLLTMFRVNSVGPILVAQAFLRLLMNGDVPKIVNVSSAMGSISGKSSGGVYGYCASKAGLNMLTRALAFDVARHGITAIVVHPGWVRTDMGGPSAPLSPEESVAGLVRVIDNLTPEDTGRFLNWDGADIPW